MVVYKVVGHLRYYVVVSIEPHMDGTFYTNIDFLIVFTFLYLVCYLLLVRN